MNTCMELFVPSDLQYGTMMDNGSFTGIVGLLASKKVDMSGVPVLINAERNKVVDPGFPVMGDPVVLGYIRPVQRADLAGFVKPFTLQVWGFLLFGLAVVLAGLVVVQVSDARLYDRSIRTVNDIRETGASWQQGAKVPHATKHGAWWTALQWTVAAPLAQAWWRDPSEGRVRTLAGIWLLSSFVLATVYRSNLKAMLILPHLSLPFNSLEEFLETDIRCFAMEASVTHENIKASAPGTPLHRLKKQLTVHNNDLRAAVDFLQGKYAGMGGYYSFLTMTQPSFDKTKTCKYYIAETIFGSLTFSFLFPKGSSLKPRVDHIVSNLKDTGIVDHLLRRNYEEAKLCSRPMASITLATTLRPLELGDFFGVFFLYGAGMMAAAFAFLVELCFR